VINFRPAVGALAVLLGTIAPGHAADQQPGDKPAYCAGPGAYRLSECGLTEQQAIEAEAAAAARSPKIMATTSRAPKSCSVSAAQFGALRTGMSYGQATSTLGCAGEEISRSEVGQYLTIMYTWRGSGFVSNMNATFQNGQLMSKAQLGLR